MVVLEVWDKPTSHMLLWNSLEWVINGPNSNNPPPIPKSEMKKKDRCAVSLLIYQSFGMSPIRDELIARITRFIFPQLKNGLGLEFSVICGQTSPEITTDTRLPKQPRLTGALMVCSRIF